MNSPEIQAALPPRTDIAPPAPWLLDLLAEVGPQVVITDPAERAFHAQDVFSAGACPAAVLRPRDADELQRALLRLHAARVAVVPRGGGLSYTEGFQPRSEHSVVLDLARLDRLVTLNLVDRYVVVEAGMTWAALDAALAPHGLRTPYWGPLSGLRSTVGGALSQGSVFLGSGLHGAVGDSVLGLDVLTVDGRWLTTGAAAAGNTPPFMRWFGPDMTGLFIGDAGALGVKVRASLRLIARPAHLDFVSFEFDDASDMMAAMAEVSRQGLAAECFGFDPVLVEQRLKRASLMSDAKTLLQVVRQSGLKAGSRLVAAGRDFIGSGKFSAHATIEADHPASLRARVDAVTAIFGRQGRATDNSLPMALRAAPFVAPNSMLGPAGERWVPVHGVFAHSQALAGYQACLALFEERRGLLEEHAIRVGCLMTTVAAQGTLVEPVFYWPDSHTPYHRRMVEPDYLRRVGEPAANPKTTALVAQLKRDTADAMRRAGAVHFQLGKFYRWREGRDPASLALFDVLKQALDPNGLMNPGVLC